MTTQRETITQTFPSTIGETHPWLSVSFTNDTYGILHDVSALLAEAKVRCDRANMRGGYTGNPSDELDTALAAVIRAMARL